MCNCMPDRRGLCDECAAKSRDAEADRERKSHEDALRYIRTCPDSPEREAALLALGDDGAYKRDIARRNAEAARDREDALLREAALILQRRGIDTLPKPKTTKSKVESPATHIRVKSDKDPQLVGLVLPIHTAQPDGSWEVDVTEIAAALAKRGKKGDVVHAKAVGRLNRYQAMQKVCAVFRPPHAEPVT